MGVKQRRYYDQRSILSLTLLACILFLLCSVSLHANEMLLLGERVSGADAVKARSSSFQSSNYTPQLLTILNSRLSLLVATPRLPSLFSSH